MAAVAIAAGCALLAVVWALHHLRLVATAVRYAPELLASQLGGRGDRLGAQQQSEALGRQQPSWEAQLAREVVEARDETEARACANAVLLDVDLQLSPAVRIYAACARISVFGCLLGVAVQFMQGVGLTTVVLDVFSMGAAGVFVALTAAREARRMVGERRAAIDVWVERLMASCWPAAWEGGQEEDASSI